ncbi:MAG: glycosyltransferase [Gammaproteobacteria bacterium]|nr:glycosyltransferase [Gammaproteobacteria bacterium]
MKLGGVNVAVLLAAYNGTPWLSEQVQSILQQEDVQVTIFISVDTSSDGTEEWVDDLARQDVRVRILPHGKVFGGAGSNFFRLIRESEIDQFDYVSFSDQDDIWNERKLAVAVDLMQATNSDAYSSDVMAFWEDGSKKLIVKSQDQVDFDYFFEAAGPGCTYVFTKDFMQSLKLHMLARWDELQNVSLHDWLCYAYARAGGYKWIIDHRPSMLYRQHARNQVGVNRGFKAYKHRLNKVLDGWWLHQSLLIAHIIAVERNEFVKQWADLGRYSLFKLAFRAPQCRRKRSDQFFFFCLCLLVAVFGLKKR